MESKMKKKRRSGGFCLLLAGLLAIGMAAGCGQQAAETRTAPETTKQTEGESGFAGKLDKKKTETQAAPEPETAAGVSMSGEAQASLEKLRMEMEGTPQKFAVAYLGYVGESGTDLTARIEDIFPQLPETYPFLKEIGTEQTVGSLGDFYCIVPRDENAKITVSQLITEKDADGREIEAGEILYQGGGAPIFLLCNPYCYVDSTDVEITITGVNGEETVWQPIFMMEESSLLLPRNEAGETLALDFTCYPNESMGFPNVDSMGYNRPTAEDLKDSCWYRKGYTADGTGAEYSLDLYEGIYYYYEGEANFSCLYEDGDSEYYQGWWYLEAAEDGTHLCLELYAENGERVANRFPVFIDETGMELLIYQGLDEGMMLPFLDEETPFCFMTRAFG